MSGGSKVKKPPTQGFSRGSIVTGISLAVAVLALVVVVFYALKATNVVETAALVVGDREVSRADYDKFVDEGKELGISEAKVKEVVIEYEKNRNIADKHDITLNETFVELSRNNLASELAARKINVPEDKLQSAKGDVIEMLKYTSAMDNYLLNSTIGGTHMIVYDAPYYVGRGTDEEKADAQEKSRAFLSSLRAKIESGEISPADALDTTQARGSGMPTKVGYYFFRNDNSSDPEEFSSQVQDGIVDPVFMAGYLEGKKDGLTEISNHEGRNEFFIDILFRQAASDNLYNNSAEDKEQMKVVDYVRN